MLTIAIDPGASGGIAAQCQDGRVFATKMPDTPKDIYDLLAGINHSAYSHHVCAIVERVGFHVKGNSAMASCKFARHCGHIEMALISCGISFEEVTPQKWMKYIGVMPKEKAARKNHIKDLMQRRYPEIKVTLWNADALGILTWKLENSK